jgi:hypothetical protein
MTTGEIKFALERPLALKRGEVLPWRVFNASPSEGPRRMSTIPEKRRGTCAQCQARCRAIPVETLWHFDRDQAAYWRWASRLLCPVCRTAQLHFWFGTRREQAGVQLRLLSDADAPLRVLSEARLSHADLADLATVAAAEARSRRSAPAPGARQQLPGARAGHLSA